MMVETDKPRQSVLYSSKEQARWFRAKWGGKCRRVLWGGTMGLLRRGWGRAECRGAAWGWRSGREAEQEAQCAEAAGHGWEGLGAERVSQRRPAGAGAAVLLRVLGTHAWVWAEEWVTGPESRVTEVTWLCQGRVWREGQGGCG